jgi:polyhydroxybutyrate depolymerase
VTAAAAPARALCPVLTGWGPRSYVLTGADQAARGALVFAFHGGNGSAPRFAERSGLAEAFAALGHAVAFPQARDHWADGRPALEEGWAADRGLVEAIRSGQDGGKAAPVALVGGSNGGMFALRLACELRPPPAAAAVVAAAMPADYAARAPTGPPVPVMLVQSTEDRFIPWRGGEVPQIPGVSVPGPLLGADAVAAFWLDRNRCLGEPRLRRGAIGAVPIEIYAWDGAPDGAAVWRVVLRGAGHRLLDRSPGSRLRGSLEELIARFVVWHLDRGRLAPGAAA